MKPGDHLFLVDGSSYIFRAYHALPPLTRKSDGLPVGAVAGFCNMLWKLVQDARNTQVGVAPTHFAVIFDYSSKTFRNALYPEYKANRTEPPEDLRPQFGLIRQATRAFNLACIEMEGFEADDLIATYARQAREAGGDVTIVSSDKDLMQLVGDKVILYDQMKDKRIGIPEVVEKWGVGPEKMIDLQALVGDSTDNVPGVPGIGEKVAAQLLSEIGSIDELIGLGSQPDKIIAEFEHRLDLVLTRLREVAGLKLNPSSAQQVGSVLFDKFGISDLPTDKKGSVVARSEDIEKLADRGNKFCKDILRARGLQRLVSSGLATVAENAEMARLSRQLVTLKDDVPLESPLDGLVLQPTDGPRLVAFLKALEFTTLTRRVAEATGADAGTIEPAQVTTGEKSAMRGPDLDPAGNETSKSTGTIGKSVRGEPESGPLSPAALVQARRNEAAAAKFDLAAYECVRDAGRLAQWAAMMREAGIAAIDAATTSPDPMQAGIIGLSLAIAPGKACYVPIGHRKGTGDLLGGGVIAGQIGEVDALEILKPALEDASILKIGQNLKFDWLMFAERGIRLAPFDDTLLMSYVLDAGRGDHGLDELSGRWLGHPRISLNELTGTGRSRIAFDQVELDKATRYGAEEADVTLRLWRVLKPRLAAEGMARVYERLERPLIDVVGKMEQRGIAIDRQILSRLSGEMAQSAARIEGEIHKAAGESFNIGSPKQLGDILFGKMNLPGAAKTKTGQWSTSAQVLEDLAAEGHLLPKMIVNWRQVTKLKSTYTDALPGYIHPRTGRVHTSYAMASTSTGRLSSSEPNLQNIPVRTEEGRKIRTAFIAEKGNRLVSADYSQIELRVLAHIADIPQLRKAFADGLDIHAMTASEMFGVPVKGMDPMVRRRAKAINFGIIYGISAFGLANQLSIPREEAAEYIRTYFLRFPGIRDYMETTKKFCKEKGYVETVFGRKAHYPDIVNSNPQVRAFNERAAINAPIQGSAADIIRRAMARMDGALASAGLGARMLLQVHDELVFEVAAGEVEKSLPVITRTMEDAPHPALRLSVPLKVDARAAANWEEAH